MTASTDELDDIVTFFEGKWTNGNTDSITPSISKIIDEMNPDCQSTDWVLIYSLPATHAANALSGSSKRVTFPLRADIRVGAAYGTTDALRRTHACKVRDEFIRILDATINLAGDSTLGAAGQGFDYIHESYDVNDLSDKLRKMHRFNVDFKLVKLNKSRT